MQPEIIERMDAVPEGWKIRRATCLLPNCITCAARFRTIITMVTRN